MSETSAKVRQPPGVIRRALVLGSALWCAVILYVFVAVSLLGVMYPLGQGILATWVYGLLFLQPYFPHGGKLDLPIGLVHAFGLYKCCQWIWRRRRMVGRMRSADPP
jgi:hypothetical protein